MKLPKISSITRKIRHNSAPFLNLPFLSVSEKKFRKLLEKKTKLTEIQLPLSFFHLFFLHNQFFYPNLVVGQQSPSLTHLVI